jgi:hypothetical protein
MMISTRNIATVVLALGLSACVSAAPPASRALAPAGQVFQAGMSQSTGAVALPEANTVYLQAQYDVEAVRVSVPRSLKVSEANTFKPRADIVWRGEPRGDRHVQVAAIVQEGMQTGTAAMQEGRQVNVDVEVTRFHALTEKTRYTIGGVHEMRFVLTVSDATTGAVIDGPREVIADVKAAGGTLAIAEDQAGRTQRVVTVARLAEVVRRELSTPLSQEQLVSRLMVPQGAISQ